MKKILVIAALVLTGCNNWLDVKSDTRVVGKELFKTPDGFHAAVNGVYTLVADPSLYSKELNWGLASVLGNNYDAALLPSRYGQTAAGSYDDVAARAVSDPVWEAAYNAIANANEVLEQARGKSGSFFPAGDLERNMIMGEMLGVRAMLHLDVLRLFAPAVDDSKPHIPYVDTYPAQQSPHLKVSEVLGRIAADLAEAKRLLRPFDVELDPTSSALFEKQFYTMRNTRMNWAAATALLARTQLWAGRLDLAAAQAQELWDYNTTAQKFNFLFESGHVKMQGDILLAAWSEKQYDYLAAAVQSGRDFFYKNTDVLFSGDEDDYRLVHLVEYYLAMPVSARWQNPGLLIMPAEGKLAPIIRMSEMLYVLVEAKIEVGDTPAAMQMLNDFRFERGAKRALPLDLTKEDALAALRLDQTREWMSEGQTFFLYKRLGQPIFNGATPLSINYVLPLPRSETDYM